MIIMRLERLLKEIEKEKAAPDGLTGREEEYIMQLNNVRQFDFEAYCDYLHRYHEVRNSKLSQRSLR